MTAILEPDSPCRGAAPLLITSDTFVPRCDAGLADDRELGLAIDSIALDVRRPAMRPALSQP
jgi:hypothetical protein